MGNSIGVKKRTAKVMKIDGTAFRLKPPAIAADVLRDHPGFNILESEEVKQLGVRAKPLLPEAPLKPGKLYFLVELPRFPDKRAPRRAWSGALQVGAKERLESLMLTRRSTSDLSLATSSAEKTEDEGAVRVRMRLPKKEVERLMEESKNAAEAAEKIMELFVAKEKAGTPAGTPVMTPARSPLLTPARSPLLTPARSPLMTPARTPDWMPALTKTPDVRPVRKEKRTRFVALPDEIIA